MHDKLLDVALMLLGVEVAQLCPQVVVDIIEQSHVWHVRVGIGKLPLVHLGVSVAVLCRI